MAEDEEVHEDLLFRVKNTPEGPETGNSSTARILGVRNDVEKTKSENINYIKNNFKFLDKTLYIRFLQIIMRDCRHTASDHDDGVRVDLDKLPVDITNQLKVFIENNINL